MAQRQRATRRQNELQQYPSHDPRCIGPVTQCGFAIRPIRVLDRLVSRSPEATPHEPAEAAAGENAER
jgi:hypothetical protein